MALTSVLGSGMAAIGASYRLRQEDVPHVAFDMNAHAGGHTSSHRDEHGFVFDEGPHISFTKDERMQGAVRRERRRRLSCRSAPG